jgi:cytidylate kinase
MTIPHSLKVLMIVDPEVAAQRIYDEYVNGGRQGEAVYNSVADVKIANTARKQSDEERYLAIYGLRVADTRLYDMVIDTTRMKVDEVVESIR